MKRKKSKLFPSKRTLPETPAKRILHTMQINSHQFEDVYKDLNINLDELGAVMLDIRPPDFIPFIPPEILHNKKVEDRFWINGYSLTQNPHVTLLYGLLKPAKEYEPYIEKVLRDWKLDSVEVEEVGFFDSPYKDEPYYCLVGHIKKTPELVEGHHRLELLPHINTFVDYKPHITIAYIEKNEEMRDDAIEVLNNFFSGEKLQVKKKLNLGDER